MTRGLTILVALCCLVLMTMAGTPAFAGKRVALVIGNSQYKDERLRLPNPRNDADDVGKALTGLGFSVTTSTDLTLDSFDETLSKFKITAQDAEIALFFYAGHAVQFDHVNYFIPTDAVIERPEQMKRAAVSIDDIQDSLKNVQGAQVMILDSCRDNPFTGLKLATRALAITRGLDRIQVGSGDSVILYSTRANEVALDGVDTRNSPFSAALVEQLKQPGRQELGSLLQQVASKVKTRTGGKQSPELTMSISGDYYFDLANDRLEWDSIRNTLDPDKLRQFAMRFPDSTYRRDAERKAEFFEQERDRRRKEDEARQQQEAEQLRKAEEEHLKSVCALGNQLLGMLVDGRDLEGLNRLSRQNACPSLKGPIEQAIVAVADNARQAKCEKLDEALRRATLAGSDKDFDALRADAGTCVGMPDRIAKALDDIRATRERERLVAEHRRVCEAEQASLDVLRTSDRIDRIAALGRLGTAAVCDEVRESASALAVALKADAAEKAHAAAQQSACAAENKTLEALAVQGPRAVIEALGRAHQCEALDIGPSLAKFDLLVEQRRQLAACTTENKTLEALTIQGPRPAIEALERTHQCPSLDVGPALAKYDAMVEQRRQDTACAAENKSLDALVVQGPRSAIEALAQSHQCPSLDVGEALAKFDGVVEQRRQQALAACAAVDLTRFRDNGDVKGLKDLSIRCPSRTDEVTAALATIEGKRRLAEACQREKGELEGYVIARQQPAVAALETRATCPDLDFAAAGRRIAKAVCDTDIASVVRVAGTDEATLRSLAANERMCPDARTQAAARLNALVASRQSDDQGCEEAVVQAVGQGDLARLQRLSSDARCERRKALVATQVDALRTAERARIAEAKCNTDAATLAKVATEDDSALRALGSNPQTCDRVRTAAAARLSALLAARDTDDRACDAAAGTAAAERNVDALQRLRADRVCVRRQSAVATKLAGVLAEERERIRGAQRKLVLIGCYAGSASGLIDDATRRALSAYWTIKHQGEPAPTTISLDLSSELNLQGAPICLPTPVAPPVEPKPPVVVVPKPKVPASVASAEPEDDEAATMRKGGPRQKPTERRKDRVERPEKKKVIALPPVAHHPVRERTRVAVPRPSAPFRPAPPMTAEPASAPKPHIFY